jgi:hypothetical protein
MGWQRLLHDLGAISFILIGFAHIYVRLLRANWPKFASMVTGTIGAREYYEKHDPTRWPAPSVNATEPDKVVQTRAEPVQRKRLYGRRPSKAART